MIRSQEELAILVPAPAVAQTLLRGKVKLFSRRCRRQSGADSYDGLSFYG